MSERKNNLAEMHAAQKLLGWYDRHRRVLPWRALPGETPDPYRVWLSEIMLQQTTVVTVKPYYEKFLQLFPTIHDLAAAPDDAVMTAWAGLGYYSRARNLLKCARTLVTAHDGVFPQSESALLTLPGIVGGHQQTAQHMAWDILTEPLPISASPRWGIPDGPGLSVTVDEEQVAMSHEYYLEVGQFLPYQESMIAREVDP